MSAAAGFTRDELHAERQRDVQLAPTDFQRMLEQPVKFTVQEHNIILQTCCNGASKQEAEQLIAIAEARGLNPIKGECFFVKRWDSAKKQEVWSVQASIDSFRIKADETGLYDGQDEPEYQYGPDDKLVLAKVRVWRKGIGRPFVGVARYDEYVQTARDKQSGNERPTKFWARMPHNQLAKCAEALAFRKAFPARFSRIYTPEEMAQADNEVQAAPPHDEETGEVLETDQAPLKLNAAFEDFASKLARAANLKELETTWKASHEARVKGLITIEERNNLASLKNMAKLRLKETEREPGEEG